MQDVNHAVLAVGYGVSEEGTPYWTIKNSWGDSWGDAGFFKMEMGKNMCGELFYVFLFIYIYIFFVNESESERQLRTVEGNVITQFWMVSLQVLQLVLRTLLFLRASSLVNIDWSRFESFDK